MGIRTDPGGTDSPLTICRDRRRSSSSSTRPFSKSIIKSTTEAATATTTATIPAITPICPTNERIDHGHSNRRSPGSRPGRCKVVDLPLYLLASALYLLSYVHTGTSSFQDAVHITAILGESVVFNCHVEFPEGHPVPYVLQWEKKGQDIPIYIWYESYPTHSGEGYEGRVSRVSPDSPYGAASLNLTNIRETDQGWYECKVVFLNRSPNSHKNGTWFNLDVHAPPRFLVTPEDVIYVSLGDDIILNCQAEGTPGPEILWYKDANPVEPSATMGIFNDGTELRISSIRHEDIGDYTCIARNGEGQISHTARVIIAGGAVIMVPPTNQTKLEGEKVQFNCEAKALPGNVTVKWFREGAPVREVAALETRVTIRKDGSLVVNPVSADDSGQYLCEVSNGIGEPQSASAYLNVEYPAKVTFTPTVQYLPFRLAGVVQCYIKSNPPLQYVTWTKDKRLLEPYQTKDIVIMNNGSLLFTRVNQSHQGRYTCTPYNAQGTQGSSGPMEVLVRKPPSFSVEPEPMYQRKVGDTAEMACDAQEAEGTQKPILQWQRQDGTPLPKNRVRISGGNITIESLRKTDFGYYQCLASNEVATIVSSTQLVVEGTQPHAPYNITGAASDFSVTLTWLPGYSGGPDYKQDYIIGYREAGTSEWNTIPVTPSGSTQVTINRLTPGTSYEFQVSGKNSLGEGMNSKIITVKTLGVDVSLPHKIQVTPPPLMTESDDTAPKPGPPRNVTVTEYPNGFLITWQVPQERVNLVQYYTIKYRTDGPWKTLNKNSIRPEDNQYLVKNLVGGRTYYFRILANTHKSFETSEEIKFPVPARVKHKAITAGVVGGFLFFFVAIILSVCAVKICNKRKRRKQEKAYNMVACRVADNRNGGNASDSQVPLKKLREGRIPGLGAFVLVANWVWPRDRCHGSSRSSVVSSIWSPDYHHQRTTAASNAAHKSLASISRAADGRFILAGGGTLYSKDLIAVNAAAVAAAAAISAANDAANETYSNISSSDDGGFLPKRTSNNRASWRKPLIGYPSQLSLRSDASGQSGAHHGHAHAQQQDLNQLTAQYHQLQQQHQYLQNLVVQTATQPQSQYPHYCNFSQFAQPPQPPEQYPPPLSTVYTLPHHYHPHQHNHLGGGALPHQYQPVQQQYYYQSSPAASSNTNTAGGGGSLMMLSNRPVSPLMLSYFNDLSSVRERSYPMLPSSPGIVQLRSVHERYSQELPSLRAIHEESHLHHLHQYEQQQQQQMLEQGFIPVHPIRDSPRRHHHHQTSRSRARLLPRHARIARSAPELLDVAATVGVSGVDSGVDRSPESRSSSSGFGSKNTSSQPNHSNGSTHHLLDWKLPPYRHPPPPPTTSTGGGATTLPHPPPPGNWLLEMALSAASPSPSIVSLKAVDVGSVDGHYEFDPATPTPTPSTPPTTIAAAAQSQLFDLKGYGGGDNAGRTASGTVGTIAGKYLRSYDNIDARVRAMKEEFHAFRKRQANRRHHELESIC